MILSESFLVELRKFFEQIKPEEEGSVCISSQRTDEDEILSLVISIEYKDRMISNNIINFGIKDNAIFIYPDKSFIKDKYLEDKIYGHEKELYDLFRPEGRFLATAKYDLGKEQDMEIHYFNTPQKFEEKYTIKGNKVHVKTISEEDLDIDFA